MFPVLGSIVPYHSRLSWLPSGSEPYLVTGHRIASHHIMSCCFECIIVFTDIPMYLCI